MRILTSEEVRQAELATADRPEMSPLLLMQRAGSAVAQFCVSHFKFASVCVICGKGRSGGAGLAAAESLAGDDGNISVIILAKEAGELQPDTAIMGSRLNLEVIWVSSEAEFETLGVRDAFQADLIIDAIAGGDAHALSDLDRKAVEAINDAFGTVVSVDLPSGVDAESTAPIHRDGAGSVFAHGVITFIAPKLAHVFGELTAGPIAVSEIGVQPILVSNKTKLAVITGQEVGIAFRRQWNGAHEGPLGRVLVLGGSLSKVGSASLAGLAALCAGASQATVACPKSIQAAVAAFAPELVTEDLPETGEGSISMAAGERVNQLLGDSDAIVLGPRLCDNQETKELVQQLMKRCPLPLVLDVDGPNGFAGRLEELKCSRHAGAFRVLSLGPEEAARLLGTSLAEIQKDRVEAARRISRESGSCVVLRGWPVVVAGLSGEAWINMTGNLALNRAGSSDVLCGMIGAALARQSSSSLPPGQSGAPEFQQATTGVQELPGVNSDAEFKRRYVQQLQQNSLQASAFLQDVRVAAAVYLHGLAADIARDRLHENTVLATDITKSLAEAFGKCDLQVDEALFYLQK